MSKLLSDEELEKLIIDEWLVHDEECNYSYYGAKCNCIQANVAKNLVPIINTQKRLHADMVMGESREYQKLEQCPRCSARQYACSCSDAEECLIAEQRERNK